MKVSKAAKLWLEYHKCHSKENSIRVHKLETIGVFALMIPEIAIQKMKISSTLRTCDMSDIAVSTSSKYSVFVIAIYRLITSEIRNGIHVK